jgi:hypothetical protein
MIESNQYLSKRKHHAGRSSISAGTVLFLSVDKRGIITKAEHGINILQTYVLCIIIGLWVKIGFVFESKANGEIKKV